MCSDSRPSFQYDPGGPDDRRQETIDLDAAALTAHSLRRGEGVLTSTGALSVTTGKFTGRSPGDKYIVRWPEMAPQIWWGQVNQPMEPEAFDRLAVRVREAHRRTTMYEQNLWAGADPAVSVPVKVVTTRAWQALFARQLFLRERPAGAPGGEAFTVLCAPECAADPSADGTRSETFIALDLKRRIVLIGGTEYAGEIKKSIFTALNFILPAQGTFPMHCAANLNPATGQTVLFFGLSGTGKTTLSADSRFTLIGDDEHGWNESGVFNFEGGCYAKCIGLTSEREPEIWRAIRSGAVLENVVLGPGGVADFDSAALTENTRAAYPLSSIPNASPLGRGPQPRHILFLTADAFGVLPPVSRLTKEQALYHFLSGYTAKTAGTERDMGSEPQATFSACFAQPFLPRPPGDYAAMLAERLGAPDAPEAWLVNTGWVGGPYGTGRRIDLNHTRAIVAAIIAERVGPNRAEPERRFGLYLPEWIDGVPQEILDPREMWPNGGDYDRQAARLAGMFRDNFRTRLAGAGSLAAAGGPPDEESV